jgi:hypothetical protein
MYKDVAQQCTCTQPLCSRPCTPRATHNMTVLPGLHQPPLQLCPARTPLAARQEQIGFCLACSYTGDAHCPYAHALVLKLAPRLQQPACLPSLFGNRLEESCSLDFSQVWHLANHMDSCSSMLRLCLSVNCWAYCRARLRCRTHDAGCFAGECQA